MPSRIVNTARDELFEGLRNPSVLVRKWLSCIQKWNKLLSPLRKKRRKEVYLLINKNIFTFFDLQQQKYGITKAQYTAKYRCVNTSCCLLLRGEYKYIINSEYVCLVHDITFNSDNKLYFENNIKNSYVAGVTFLLLLCDIKVLCYGNLQPGVLSTLNTELQII